MAKLTIKDLLEAGVHFGHQKKRWNPKMKEFVYGFKNGISIIDLTKTMRQIADAINFLQSKVQNGGKILFIGTKRQAQQVVKEAAEKTGMFYVTERWLGGTLTNNITIRQSIQKMDKIDSILNSPSVSGMKKKELASLKRQSLCLHRNLDGIYSMTRLPDVVFIVDVTKEHIAVNEAKKLNIPIVAIIDTDGNPDGIDYLITSNDDAVRSIGVIINVITESISEAAQLYSKKKEESKPKAKPKTEKKEAKSEKKSEPEKISTPEIKETKIEEEKTEPQQEKTSDVGQQDTEEVKKEAEVKEVPEKADKAQEETKTKEKKKAPAKKRTVKKTTSAKKSVKDSSSDKDKKDDDVKDEEKPKEKKKTVRKRRTVKKTAETTSETNKKDEKTKEKKEITETDKVKEDN